MTLQEFFANLSWQAFIELTPAEALALVVLVALPVYVLLRVIVALIVLFAD